MNSLDKKQAALIIIGVLIVGSLLYFDLSNESETKTSDHKIIYVDEFGITINQNIVRTWYNVTLDNQYVACNSTDKIEYDHVIPFSKGGSNTEKNIQLLCQSCNRSKWGYIQ